MMTRPTALVLAAALFLAATTAAHAAPQPDTAAALPANSVTSPTVSNGSLWAQDLNPAVVDWFTDRTPAPGSVTENQLTPAVRAKLNHATETVTGARRWVADHGTALQTAQVTCPAGKRPTGGGYRRGDDGVAGYRDLQVVTSAPTPTGWLVEGFNNDRTTDLPVRAYAVCAATS